MDKRMLLSNLDVLATAPGGVARLRELILTLAVQGKLVPQDALDEPAGVLLEKIGAEKERLVAAGKIKRGKPLAEISEEEKPFGLPVGWEWVRIPEVTHSLGQGAPTDRFSYIDVAAIDNKRGVVTDALETLEAADAPSRARKNVAIGTVIYSTIRPYLKNIAVIENDYVPSAVASTAFAIMHPHAGLESKYLLHYLRSAVFASFVSSKAVGIAYPAINDSNFFEGVVPLPPVAEQSRIVTRVEELMQLCDALEAKGRLEAAQHARLVSTLLATLTDSPNPEALAENWQRVSTHFDLLLDRPEAVDALEQTLLQLAVRGQLVPQDPQDEPASVLLARIRAEKDRLIAEGKIKRDKPLAAITEEEKPFGLPVGWKWVRLGLLTSLVTSGSRSWKDFYAAEGATFIRSQDIKYDRLEFDDRAFVKLPAGTEGVRTQVRLHDLLITITGANVGKAAAVSDPISEAYVSQHVALVRMLNVSLVDCIHLWLVSEYEGRKLLLMSSYGAKPGLNLQNINDLLVPLPPLPEQSRIVARVATLRRLCTDLRQRLAASQSTQAQLAEALVGAVSFSSEP